jgi:agmatine/peptidylarginine deiminase
MSSELLSATDATALEASRRQFRMQGEWARHSAVWIGWPLRPDTWRRVGSDVPAHSAVANVCTLLLLVIDAR